jgi:hypothetical protein
MNFSVRVSPLLSSDSIASGLLPTLAYHDIDYGAAVWIASSVETNVGIIFTCMHAMRPVLSKLVPGFFTASTSSKKFTPNLKTWTETSQTGFGARLKSFKFTSKKRSSVPKNFYAENSENDTSLAGNSEFSSGPTKDYFHRGPGKVDALITTGSGSGGAPANSIMYDQQVVVVRESRD